MYIICPTCKSLLIKKWKTWSCRSGHSYDVSKEWYINLLQNNSSKDKWDDKGMIIARRDFLETKLYQPLIEKVIDIINNFSKKPVILLDGGCWEWRYIRQIIEQRNNPRDSIIWIDISKPAVKLASRTTPWWFIVWSTMDIPIAKDSAHIFLSIFSPYNEDEIKRVLKPWWQAIIISPWPDHLYKFIEMIWDNPHKHQTKSLQEKYSQGWAMRHEVRYSLSISDNQTIQNLFMMTPYYRKAPKEKQDAIMKLEKFDSKAHFFIDVVKY